MSGSLVADLGIGPEVWLFLSLLGCVTLFFKFSRFWSVRNLDLMLLFARAGHDAARRRAGASQPWSPSCCCSSARRSGWSAAWSTWASPGGRCWNRT